MPERRTMKTLVLATLALGALTTATLAEPVVLTDTQMDGVTAGGTNTIQNPNFPDPDTITHNGVASTFVSVPVNPNPGAGRATNQGPAQTEVTLNKNN
jgi:hypothetical protein